MNFKTFDMSFSAYEEKWAKYKAENGITEEWYDEEDEDDIDLSSNTEQSVEVKEEEFQEVVTKKVKKMIKNHYKGTIFKFFTKNNFGYLRIDGIKKDVMFRRCDLKIKKKPFIGKCVKVDHIEEKDGKFTAFGVLIC